MPHLPAVLGPLVAQHRKAQASLGLHGAWHHQAHSLTLQAGWAGLQPQLDAWRH